jgi:hypothetical protein
LTDCCPFYSHCHSSSTSCYLVLLTSCPLLLSFGTPNLLPSNFLISFLPLPPPPQSFPDKLLYPSLSYTAILLLFFLYSHLFTLEDSVDAPENASERAALLAEEGDHLTSAGLDGVPAGQSVTRAVDKSKSTGGGASAMDEFKPISYNYAFFHLIFALASM